MKTLITLNKQNKYTKQCHTLFDFMALRMVKRACVGYINIDGYNVAVSHKKQKTCLMLHLGSDSLASTLICL